MSQDGRRVEELVAAVRQLAPLIHAHAEESERERRLAPAVVDAFEAAGLFRIFLPERFEGAGLDYVGGMPVIEEAAAADGSAGWNLAIGAGTLSFASMLDDEAAIEEILKSPRALCAGSINPMALRVLPVDGGYRVRGRLQYASGVTQSRWLVAGGLVFDGEQPRFVDGVPVLRGAFFPTSEARVLDTWRVNGLSGTGSHDVEVADVFVPAARTWEFLATAPKRHDPLAAISLPSRLGVSLVAVGLGILRRAIDELVALAGVKSPFAARGTLLRERAGVQIDVARAAGLLEGARAHVQTVCGDVFGRVRAGAAPAVADLARMRLAYVTATEALLRGIELVRGAAGMNAIQTGSPLERCWRDLHAVSQHFALGTAHYERIGKVRLGLDPGPGPI